jgi:hypothetical protein
MRRVQFQKKGIHLKTMERFHIRKEAAANNHLNDDHTIYTNKIFDTFHEGLKEENQ